MAKVLAVSQGTIMTHHFARHFGGFLIAVAAMPAAAQQTARAPDLPTIGAGQTMRGEITAPVSGCTTNPRVKMWRFEGRADERIEFTMRSEQFDTLLELGRLNGCEFESLASNDDGAGPEDGLNSRLTVRLRETGSYVIRAMSFSDDGAGSFEVAMTRLPAAAAPPPPRRLTLGQEVRGELSLQDATIPNEEQGLIEGGRPYHYYSLRGQAGDTVRLELDSDAFDPVLEVGALSPLGYSVAQYNDDGGGPEDGLNSRLNVTFRSAGTIVLRVSPLGNGVGGYRLRANRAQP
jgi:hypothetical protein